MSHDEQVEDALHISTRSSGQQQCPVDQEVASEGVDQDDTEKDASSYPPRASSTPAVRPESQVVDRLNHVDSSNNNNASGEDARKPKAGHNVGMDMYSHTAKSTADMFNKYALPLWILPHLKRPRVSEYWHRTCS